MKDNVLLDKSFAFAISVVNAYKFLSEKFKLQAKTICNS